MDTLLFNLFLLAVLLVSVWYLWFFEYRKYLLDSTRQQLFKIRDDLFYAAAVEAKIDVNSPLYHMTRTTLNGAIRYAHDFNAMHFLLTVFYGGKTMAKSPLMEEYQDRWKEAFDTVTDEQKELIIDVQQKMHLTIFHHIVRGSLVLRFVAMILSLVFMLRDLRLEQAVVSKGARDKWSLLDAEANYIGEAIAVK